MVYETIEKVPKFGIRHLQCFLLFWGITFAYSMRVNLSLAIVAMTDKSANPDFVEYHWSEKVKSMLLSSFFWGYITTQIPGGYLARKFGGKYAILISICCSSTLSILTPLAAEIGDWTLVFGLRVLQGMTQGVLFPTTHTILAKWSPLEERAVLGTYCYTGAQFGTVAMLFASGFIAASPLGWPSIFYISGGLGILWSLAWFKWGASSPNDYKGITIMEKEFIEKSLSNGKSSEDERNKRKLKTPWMKFLTSPAFLSLTIAQCAYSWSFWTILTQIPSYMKNIMGFDIKSNATLTALPYLMMFIFSFVFTALGAFVEKLKLLNLTQSRKFFNTISAWIPAMALVSLGYVDSSQTILAVSLLICAVGFASAIAVGLQMNHIDLSPNFAGIMLGTTNVIANIMSIMAPLTVGFIVTEEHNVLQWRIVFFIAAGFCFFGNLLFIIFGTAEVQPWNEPEEIDSEEMEPMKSITNEKTNKV